jgi:hypothetical protein
MVVPMRSLARIGSFLFLLVLGCGSSEEKLEPVSGTVFFDGKPIPKGNIFFDPTAETGGGQGFASILDGQFNTADPGGLGVRKGKYNIRVQGYTGKPSNELPFGAALFPEYQLSKDLSTERTLKIEIPKAAATAK